MASPLDCSCDCPTPATVSIPGLTGANGADGAAGTNGINAFTTIEAPGFTVPAESATVSAICAENSWISDGQIVIVSDGTKVANFSAVKTAVPTATTGVDLTFLSYPGDTTPGQTFAPGSTMSPAGVHGQDLLKISIIEAGTVLFTPEVGAETLFVECVGGGGGGGGCATAVTNAASGGGGGGGAYSCKFIGPGLAATYAVSIGAGGAGGTAGANPGLAGGDTYFNTAAVCMAKGGSGGTGDTVAAAHMGAAGGAGGAASSSVGDMKVDGFIGGRGFCIAAAVAIGGRGAASMFGGNAEAPVTQAAGNAGKAYGGGGSGGCILSGGANVAGGAGAAGVIRIWQFS